MKNQFYPKDYLFKKKYTTNYKDNPYFIQNFGALNFIRVCSSCMLKT